MAVDMYLKIEGIDGESTDDKHSKWIEVLSFSHGLSQPVSGASATGGRTGGRADFSHLSIAKVIDNATPDLSIKCAKGTHIPEIKLDMCLATDEKHVFGTYILKNCIVSSVSIGGSSGEGMKPVENVSFAYGSFKWEYTPIDSTGKGGTKIDRTWNLETNKQE
jgi:type VI secretion system secreted protein Hcp